MLNNKPINDLYNLLNKKQPKVSSSFDIPSKNIGEDGSLHISVLPSGPRLFVKFKNEWLHVELDHIKNLTKKNRSENIDNLYTLLVRFLDSDKSNYVGFKAASDTTQNMDYVLPSAPPTVGSSLHCNSTGIMSWAREDRIWSFSTNGYAVINDDTNGYFKEVPPDSDKPDKWTNTRALSGWTITRSQAHCAEFVCRKAGTVTEINVLGTSTGFGWDDEFFFRIMKGTPSNNASTITLYTLLATAKITPPSATTTFYGITGARTDTEYAENDRLYVELYKDANTASSTIDFNIHVSGLYSS